MAGLYIHIPFCRQKCHYCNFFSVASQKNRKPFLDALLKEIDLQRYYLEGEEVATLYFGGGTPSMLDPEEIFLLLERIRSVFSLTSDAEVTMEANPDDIRQETADLLRQAGVNRISLGVQSFRDADLAYLHRNHDSNRAIQAIEWIMEAGLTNVSIDLIYGIPTLDEAGWKHNLDVFKGFGLPHLSAYWLTVEPRTALNHLIRNGKLPAPEEEAGISQFYYLMEKAAAWGYVPYEISNLGKEGHFSQHNLSYWQGKSYLGLGPSAHSFNGKSRQWNVASLTSYIESVGQGIVPCEKEEITPHTRYQESVMTGLRTVWGVDLNKLEVSCGTSAMEYLLMQAVPYVQSGHAVRGGDFLKLTINGWLIADRIIADLFMDEE
ncbi:MAG: radical SAM family heme chaperone HemW [Bacteroidetes bacterium]|nr:radical SAM family heme chaperone HemW [Bacteroidota bacterium]